MTYMCMGCGEIYDYNMEMCPKAGCEGDVVEIDELMLPIIRTLRHKGYITSYCCSGHIYEDIAQAYVCLADVVSEVLETNELDQIRDSLPKMWSMEIDNFNRICFRHINVHAYTDFKKYEDIMNANLEFMRFVQQLPELEY